MTYLTGGARRRRPFWRSTIGCYGVVLIALGLWSLIAVGLVALWGWM